MAPLTHPVDERGCPDALLLPTQVLVELEQLRIDAGGELGPACGRPVELGDDLDELGIGVAS